MESLRELIERRAELLGAQLSELEKDKVLRDLIRWTSREAKKDRLLLTEDGSYTLWSKKFGEPYHSVTAGAVREALEKFVLPSKVVEKAKLKKRVKILDVGFGLGYNVTVAVCLIKDVEPSAEIEIISLEKELPEEVPTLPEPYRRFHKTILDLLPEGEREGVSLKLLAGDARGKIKSLAGFGADAVFHDPFSPYRNPEMWSLEFLERVRLAMDVEGFWTSYTSSLPVRRALRDLGFKVGSSRPVGRRRGGTVATIAGFVKPLNPEEEEKLLTSPFSVPFRDPDLKRDPLEILADYRISVLLREREPFSGRRARIRTTRP